MRCASAQPSSTASRCTDASTQSIGKIFGPNSSPALRRGLQLRRPGFSHFRSTVSTSLIRMLAVGGLIARESTIGSPTLHWPSTSGTRPRERRHMRCSRGVDPSFTSYSSSCKRSSSTWISTASAMAHPPKITAREAALHSRSFETRGEENRCSGRSRLRYADSSEGSKADVVSAAPGQVIDHRETPLVPPPRESRSSGTKQSHAALRSTRELLRAMTSL